jgi:hypothetical protein
MAISRRGFIRVLGTSAVILAGAGYAFSRVDQMPEEAIEGWKGPSPEIKDPRVRAIAYALLAPNPHNMQAWSVDLREPGVATFYCDRSRLLPQTDPFSRQIVIGCGCFLETLRVAAAEDGQRVDLSYFPHGAWPENAVGETPLVRLLFVQDPAVARDPLFGAILSRRSGKVNYAADKPASAEHVVAVRSVLSGLPVTFVSTSTAADVGKLRAIAAEAYRVEAGTHRTHMETVERLRVGADDIARHRDGLAMHGPMMWLLRKTGMMTPETFSDPSTFAFKSGVDLYTGWISNTWSFGWMTTAANDRVTQAETGRAYVRANLKATEIGLSMAPLSQALQEFPEMKEQMQAILAATETPAGHTLQMFFRMGYGETPEATPRRRVNDIIRT